MSTKLTLVVLAGVLIDHGASSFGLPAKGRPLVQVKSRKRRSRLLHLAKSNDDESSGMEDAFKQLDQLKALGDDSIKLPEKKEQDEAFARAMKELDLKDIPEVAPPSLEIQAELYKDMASEVEGRGDIDLIVDLKSEMGSDKTVIPQFDPTTRNTDEFMEQALEAALKEAEKQSGKIDKDSLLDNKEIMKDIEGIFDRANEKLLAGLEEIRQEQMALAREQAERNAKVSLSKIEEDQARLAVAEENMRKMLDRVNLESRNVEEAIEDLKNAQMEMEGGVDDQLASLKSGGIVKQASLVGTLLFALRAGADAVAMVGGDASHLAPAAIQGAIALACFAAFVFL